MLGTVLALTPGALASAETTIYRHADAQGITTFVDRPGGDRQAVELPAVNTYAPIESKEAVAATREDAAAPIYQSLLISVPGNGETIRHNGGNVRVTGRVEPDLRADHRAVLFVDGSAATSRQARQERARSPAERRGDIDFKLAGVARGPHTLRIAIMDQENNTLIQSATVGFHLLRATAGLP